MSKNLRKNSVIVTVKFALNLISSDSRKKIIYLTFILVLIGILDLLGVVIIGAIGALSIQLIEINNSGRRVYLLLSTLNIENLTLENQILYLSLGAGLFFLLKTIVSVVFTQKIFYLLSKENASISTSLYSKIISQDLIAIQKQNTQHTLYIVTEGTKSLVFGILATFISVVVDFSLLIILFIGLTFVDIYVAIGAILIFGLSGITLHLILKDKISKLGLKMAEFTVSSNEKILESLNLFREIFVRNLIPRYIFKFSNSREELGTLIAKSSFMPYIGKYFIETIIVLGMLTLICFQFITKSPTYAVATITIFIAASSRIAPAILRIQQGFLSISQNIGAANSTLDKFSEFSDFGSVHPLHVNAFPDFKYMGFVPELKISKLNFRYPERTDFGLEDLSLTIPSGSSFAIIGPTGSGKTTIVDLILGVLNPISGSISISDFAPKEVFIKWPGAVSYLPQDVMIVNGTIRQNIVLGYSSAENQDQLISDAINSAGMQEFIKSLPQNVDTLVGESGNMLSGGQKQRIGIARALFTKPRILVLDESTSALDTESEKVIIESLNALRGKVTIIAIAHKLSTIVNFDQVAYIEKGKIKFVGSFKAVNEWIKKNGKSNIEFSS